MRAFLGFLQFALGLGGIIALFNGQFVAMILAWLGALGVGLIGNRVVRGVMGVSQSGQDAISSIPATLHLIEEGQYSAAEGHALGAVNAFRFGGDKALLPMALLLYAVALGANSKFDQARRAIDEADSIFLSSPAKLRELNDEIRPAIVQVKRELHSPQPDAKHLVSQFLELNE